MSWGETMKIIKTLGKRLDGSDSKVSEVKAKTEEINANVLKKTSTFITAVSGIQATTAGVSALLLTGAGKVSYIRLNATSATSYTVQIILDGRNMGSVTANWPTSYSGVYGLIHIVGTSFSFIASTATSVPALGEPLLDLHYAESFEIKVSTSSGTASCTMAVNHTREV